MRRKSEGNEVAWDDSFRGFASFLHGLAKVAGGLSVTCMEVPLDVFVSTQEEGTLSGLEVAVDDHGHHFLMAMVRSEEHQAVLVSVSFDPVDIGDPGEEDMLFVPPGFLPDPEDEEGVVTDDDPRDN